MSLEPLVPLHSEVVAYQAEVHAVLAQPARAARLAELEAMSRAGPSESEFRAVGALIVAFLDEVHEEVDAARLAAGKKGAEAWRTAPVAGIRPTLREPEWWPAGVRRGESR